jgi:hypothetical protein
MKPRRHSTGMSILFAVARNIGKPPNKLSAVPG